MNQYKILVTYGRKHTTLGKTKDIVLNGINLREAVNKFMRKYLSEDILEITKYTCKIETNELSKYKGLTKNVEENLVRKITLNICISIYHNITTNRIIVLEVSKV